MWPSMTSKVILNFMKKCVFIMWLVENFTVEPIAVGTRKLSYEHFTPAFYLATQ